MNAPTVLGSIDEAVEHVLQALPGELVLGIPLGVGKPNPFVNALYRRVRDEPSRRLRIVTALSLLKPRGRSAIERRFLDPIVERVFGDYPDLEYAADLRAGRLPPNVEVCEFFLKTGEYLGNARAQQHHISTNYTFVARDMAVQGMNLVAQAVAAREDGGRLRLSLSSNPDLSAEIIERLRAEGRRFLAVAVVNRELPFMPNGAEVDPALFDLVVTDPRGTHAVFAPPNARVSLADHAIGLHATSLVADDGTLQIGIGSLGDAIANALILRERHNAAYRRAVDALAHGDVAGRELERFEHGLYGCSEMFVNGLLQLIDAGIVRREVHGDAVLQRLLDDKRIGTDVTPDTLAALLDARRIGTPLTAQDLAFLQRFGVLRDTVRLERGELVLGDHRCSADLRDAAAFDVVGKAMLGRRLAGGVTMTGGFFLGPRDFYRRLHSMPPEALAKIDMTRIGFVNQLDGDEELKRRQRRRARFINTTMMATLLGAAVSDGLEDGQVVSGVGGQYNFVAMAHALPDARLVMMLRSTHVVRGRLTSSIVWQYGHLTIPRHLRDVFVTEYGVADLRGQPDHEIVKRLACIADSRFQDELLRHAKAAGKLEADWRVPDRFRQNLPQALQQRLQPLAAAGLLPDFPFGTDLTDEEVRIARALKTLQHAMADRGALLRLAVRGLRSGRQAPPSVLQRLGLTDARGPRERLLKRLLAQAL